MSKASNITWLSLPAPKGLIPGNSVWAARRATSPAPDGAMQDASVLGEDYDAPVPVYRQSPTVSARAQGAPVSSSPFAHAKGKKDVDVAPKSPPTPRPVSQRTQWNDTMTNNPPETRNLRGGRRVETTRKESGYLSKSHDGDAQRGRRGDWSWESWGSRIGLITGDFENQRVFFAHF